MYIHTTLAIAWVKRVAIAAHATHIAGNIQYQNIKKGSAIRFKSTVVNTMIRGIFTSPSHLIIDWNIKNVKTKMIQIKDTRKKFNAFPNTSLLTHINSNI